MAVPQKPYFRRVLLINKRFQLTFLGYILGMIVLTIGIIYGSNFYFFWMFKKMGISMQLPSDHVFFSFLEAQQTQMNYVFALTGVLVSASMCLLGLFLSHRVAGPLYRLCSHLKKISADGSVEEVKFREGDFFPEVADAFNEHLRRIGKSKNVRDRESA